MLFADHLRLARPPAPFVVNEVYQPVHTPLEELASLLAKDSKKRLASPGAVATAAKDTATDSYRPHPNLNEPLNLILGAILENIGIPSQ